MRIPPVSLPPAPIRQTAYCKIFGLGCKSPSPHKRCNTISNMGARISIRSLPSSTWFLIGLIWVSIGMFDASDTVFSMRAEGHHHAWFSLFITLLLSWLPWALATPLILELGRRHPFGFTSLSGWLPHLGACTFIGLGFAAWSAALEELLNPWLQAPAPDPFAPLMMAKFFNRFVSFLILYAAIVAIAYVLDSRQRLAL